ncbi:MAG TPA: hypothetical protein VF269_01320 [Rhodanobacteraceae bacterium]
MADAVQPDQVVVDHDNRGWTMARDRYWYTPFPATDIPMVQLSINAARSAEHHLQLDENGCRCANTAC